MPKPLRSVLVAAVAAGTVAVSCLVSPVAASAAVPTARPLQTVSHTAEYTVQTFTYTGSSNALQQLTATFAPLRHDAPWIVTIHGGSWINGSQADVQDAVQMFSRKGWQVFNLSYRLAGATYADQVSDLVAARNWILAHAAQFKINPRRGAVYGFSAGGELAAAVGLAGSFRAVVSVSGVLQPQRVADDAAGMRPQTEPATSELLGLASREKTMMGCAWPGDTAACEKRWEQFLPQLAITPHSPPFLIMQGAADPVVPPPTAAAFAYWLHAQRVRATSVLVPGLGHTTKVAFGSAAREQQIRSFVAANSR